MTISDERPSDARRSDRARWSPVVTRRALLRTAVGVAGLAGLAPAARAEAVWLDPTSAPTIKRRLGRAGGTLRVAIVGEPPMIDPVPTAAALSAWTAWHWCEGLFTYDSKYAPQLMLAESYEAGNNAKTHTLRLRQGIKFHNGQDLTAKDVVASLERWGKLGVVGKDFWRRVDNIEAKDTFTVVINTKEPSGTLAIAMSSQSAAIMPAELALKYPDGPAKEFIGTGPYKFVEHLPDRYLRIQRFDGYVPRQEAPDGPAGAKVAHYDEIQFSPTPEAATRADGVLSGDFDFSETVTSDSYNTLRSAGLQTFIAKPGFSPSAIFNKKEGPFTDIRMRRAVVKALSMEPLMQAAYGRSEFYRLDPSMSAPETAFYNTVGDEVFNRPDLDEAKRLIAEAGYNGQTLRVLCTKGYTWSYNSALPMSKQLEAVGLKLDLQVMEWATMLQRRPEASAWELFITAYSAYTHPTGQVYWVNDAPPSGWYVSARRDEAMARMLAEPDTAKQADIARDLQRIYWDELPVVKLGEGFDLYAASGRLKGFRGGLDWSFWNTWLE